MLKGLRFQKRLSILPGVRINLSKGMPSASIGPRGADVNIGRGGVTTNAGIPGTGLSYRARLGGGRGLMGVLAVVAALGWWAFNHMGQVQKFIAPAAPQATTTVTGASIRYVHREGSVVRDEAKASGTVLKREAKGAQVTLLGDAGDGWAKVADGAVTGYMRASVLGNDKP